MPLTTGQILNNRYRVVKLMGQGGFGEVYRAWDLNLNVACALKENSETSAASARQFAREAKFLASLHHPNLPKVSDHFVISGQGQYLVMEYVEGEDLEEKLRKAGGPLPEAKVLPWTGQILDALAYLHRQNPPIIHRDIKPANIRITPQGQAILVDFGIAKLFDPLSKTSTGARAVTPCYSPQEQYGQGGTDARSDIYALGATLFTLLTGRQPPESVHRNLGTPLPSPRQLNPTISVTSEQAIFRAMEMLPKRRWQRAEDFKRALLPTPKIIPPVRAAPPVAKAPKPVRRSPPRARRKIPWIPVIVAGGVVILVLAVLISTITGYLIFSGKGISVGLPKTPVVGDSTSIRVGLITGMSGDNPAVGASSMKAAELAVQQINDAGGLELGGVKHKVELVLLENERKLDQPASIAQKLISEYNVLAIVGPNSSQPFAAVSEIAEKNQVVLISPWATDPDTPHASQALRSRNYTFRAYYVNPFQGHVLAKFAMENLRVRKAGVLYDATDEYSKGIAESFKHTYEENGGQVVAFTMYTTGEKDVKAKLNRIMNNGAGVILLPNYYKEVLTQINHAHDLDITVPILGTNSWESDELMKLCINSCENYYFSTHYAVDNDSAANKKFVKDFQTRFNSAPDTVAALTYDAFGLLWQAILRSGKVDRQALRDALANTPRYEGVTGVIQFQEGSGDPVKSAVILMIQKGKFVFLTNANP